MKTIDNKGNILEISHYGINFLNQRRKNNTPIFSSLPDGWQFIEQATTAPTGFKWACNNQPLWKKDALGNWCHNKNYQSAIVRVY